MNTRASWLTAGVRRDTARVATVPRVNGMLNGIRLKVELCAVQEEVPMPVHRKRFRIEEAIGGDIASIQQVVEAGDTGPMHEEIMSELRAIRAQMGSPGFSKSAAVETMEGSVTREVEEAQALLETYRAQIEQC